MAIWILLGIVVVIVIVMVVAYNRLVSLRQAVRNAEGDIDVQLRQRFDLVPQLIEVVKGYATHERELFEKITAARAAVSGAANPADRMQAESVLGKSIGGLLAVAEAYPDLKASANFTKLQDQLGDIENHIAAARRFLNNAAAEFNASIEQFPAVLIARQFGFQPATFYELPAERAGEMNEPPKVSF